MKRFLIILSLVLLIAGCDKSISSEKVDNTPKLKQSNSSEVTPKKDKIKKEGTDNSLKIGTGISSLSSGGHNTFVLADDGTAWGWGSNSFGELGIADTSNISTPVKVVGLEKCKFLSGGSVRTFVIKQDGTLWALDSSVNDGMPKKIKGFDDLVKVDGDLIALKRDGTVLTSGSNLFGECGDGTKGILEYDGMLGYTYDEKNKEKVEPVVVKNLANVVDIAAGIQFNLALRNDGTVWAWGRNKLTNLCVGSDEEAITIPTQVLGLDGVAQISAGQYAVALKKDGTVWTWGNDESVKQVVGLKNIKKISSGALHYLALDSYGKVWASGRNTYGEIGKGNTSDWEEPYEVEELSNIEDICAGDAHSIAVSKDGDVWTWGSNNSGELGIGSTENKERPTKVSIPINNGDSYLTYTNNKFGFSLGLPNNWQGKYIVNETDKGIVIYHNVNSETKGDFFSISQFGTEEEWSKWVENVGDEFPYKKLGVKNGKVFVVSQSSDMPYLDSTSKESKEFFTMLQDTDDIINSFKLTQ